MRKILPLLLFFCLAASLPSQTLSLEESLASLAAYDDGRDDSALRSLERHVGYVSGDPAQREQTATKLATLLGQQQTTAAAKLFICQQLRVIGGPAQIPILSALLSSPETADMARLALEVIPGELAAKALMERLSQSQGKHLVGIINSLAERREAGAVKALAQLLAHTDPKVACAAALALGNIGNAPAASSLAASKRPELSPALWDAQLRCGQRLATAGARKVAMALYAALAPAAETLERRMAVLAGRVNADPSASLPFVLEGLRSPDQDLQAEAAQLSGVVPGEAATRQLAGLLPGLNPAGRRALLSALAERGDRSAAEAVQALLSDPDTAVQAQAVQTLGRIGDASCLESLIQTAARNSATVRQLVRQALAGLSAPEVDARLVALAEFGDAPTRLVAILALADRQYLAAVPMIQRAIGSNDLQDEKAAFDALAILSGPEHYQFLVSAMLSKAGSPAGESAEHAVLVVAKRIPNSTARIQPWLDTFGSTKGAGRCAVIRVLGVFGGPAALRAVVGSLKDSDAEVRDTTVRTLADWPDEAALDTLLALSKEAEKPVYRNLALRGYLRLALEAKSGQTALLAQALQAVQTDADKRALLGALGESGQTEALATATKLLGDQAVGGDAALTVVNLAATVGKEDPLAAEEALKRVVELSQDAALKARAGELLKQTWITAETMAAPYDAAVAIERRKELAGTLPTEDKLVAYLDCGLITRTEGAGGILLRQLNGKAWNFEAAGFNPTCGTVAFDGRRVVFELTGLEPAKAYALGFTWWDGDGGGRSQSVQFLSASGTDPISALPITVLPSAAEKKSPAKIQVPVPAAVVAQGRIVVAFNQHSGPNAVVGELWLIETKPGSRSAMQVEQATIAVQPPKPVDMNPSAEGTGILLVTGIDYPGHPWQRTAPTLKEILERDPRLKVRIVENPDILASPRLKEWAAVIIHFMDWEKPGPGPEARENLRRFVASGKGLILTHFACGAWDGNEWPEFKNLAGRVWDPKLRGHDPHGTFRVEIADPEHPITKGLRSFETVDELYTCLAGDVPIHVVAKATSKVDSKEYPLAFVLDYGRGRVFHTVLGHDAHAYTNNLEVGELLRRGCSWAAGMAPPNLN